MTVPREVSCAEVRPRGQKDSNTHTPRIGAPRCSRERISFPGSRRSAVHGSGGTTGEDHMETQQQPEQTPPAPAPAAAAPAPPPPPPRQAQEDTPDIQPPE